MAVYTDPRSAAVLTGLPGLQLDASVVEAVLTAADPVAAGVAAAVHEALALLAVDGVHGQLGAVHDVATVGGRHELPA